MGEMKSAGKIQFNIPGILYEVKMSRIFLGTNSRELTSPGKLCNDRFMFELTKENIDIKKQKFTMCGHRNHITGLWNMPLKSANPYLKKKVNEEKDFCATVYLQQKTTHI